MKAISIWQPWAWLIIRPDLTDPVARINAWMSHEIKNIENRTWSPGNRHFPLLIHASKTIDLEAWAWVRQRFPSIVMPPPNEMAIGGIVGRVNYTGSMNYFCSNPWWTGPCGWVLIEPRPLPFVPLRGMPGLFDVHVPIPEAQ